MFLSEIRDRFKLLEKRFREKQRQEDLASGISPEQTEINIALEEIISNMTEAEQMYDKMTEEKKEKIEKDKNSAEEMSVESLETFKETRKRNSEDKEYYGNGKKRPRSTGSETLVYLRENAENMKEV